MGMKDMEKTVTTEIDPVVAKVVRSLTPMARERLENYIRRSACSPKLAKHGFRATAPEMPGTEGVIAIEARVRRGRTAFSLDLGGGVIWNNRRLIISKSLPSSLIGAMGRRPMVQIVDHHLLEDIEASSARLNGDSIVVEPRSMTTIPLERISSDGRHTERSVLETLRSLGIQEVCTVGTKLIKDLRPYAMQGMLERLLTEGRADLSDLISWMPVGVESVEVEMDGVRLNCHASLSSGRFRTGCLTLSGEHQSRSRILGGWLFTSYKSWRYQSRSRIPKNPYHSFKEFENQVAKREDVGQIAA